MCGVPAVRDSLQRSTRHALGEESEVWEGRCDSAARASCDTLHRSALSLLPGALHMSTK